MIKEWLKRLKSKYIYEVPYSFTSEEWKAWTKETKDKYPLQYFIRDTWADCVHYIRRRYWDCKDAVRYIFKPCNPIIRKAIPRGYRDLSGLTTDINLAIILQFKEEADAGLVDWDANEYHREFKAWLDDAADWVKVRRPALQAAQDASYPPLQTTMDDLFSTRGIQGSYEESYGEVNRLEQLIEDTDTKYMKELIDRRAYLWT